jgi:SAM-dependent methyltransferase
MTHHLGFLAYAGEVIKGKDSARILTNARMLGTKLRGAILDVGGGGVRASHFRFLETEEGATIKTADINPSSQPDIVINLEEEKLPLPDETMDHVLAFNIFEHLSKRRLVAEEIRRVLRKGGTLIGSVPFLVNVHPDPKDFVRLTRQGLEELLLDAGFRHAEITAIGRGPFTAGFYQIEFLLPKGLRLLLLPIIWALDSFVMRLKPKVSWTERQPLAYCFIAEK